MGNGVYMLLTITLSVSLVMVSKEILNSCQVTVRSISQYLQLVILLGRLVEGLSLKQAEGIKDNIIKMRTSDFQPTKCVSNKQQTMDWFNELPDEIIVHTLSFLTLQEATRTSVLSKRWEYLWKDVPKLDLSDVKLWVGWLGDYRLQIPPECGEKYVALVNKVLGSHRATKLDVFRIQFELGDDFKEDIDSWLQRALSRTVDRLDLNLSIYGIDVCVCPAYTLSSDVLGLSPENASVGYPSVAFPGFKTLRALTLNAVNLSESIVASILYNCPLLEDLVVANNEQLEQLQVSGKTLALKHLEIVWCDQLVSLTICDINIVSLKVTNGENLVLKNVPKLVDVCIGGFYGGGLDLVSHSVDRLWCCLSNLVNLTLVIDPCQVEAASAEFAEVGVKELAHDLLPQLRQLTFFLMPPQDISLLPFTPLMRASPMLEKFVVKFDQQLAQRDAFINKDPMPVVGAGLKKGFVHSPLRNLKVVELCGYMGHSKREVELVEYIVENRVALEKFVIDVRGDQSVYRWSVLHRSDHVAISQARKQLLPLLPSNVQLVFL